MPLATLKPPIQTMSAQLCDYWEQVRVKRPYPSEDDIAPEAIPTLWEHCFVLQRRDVEHPDRGNFTYLGSAILRAYERGVLCASDKRIVAPKDFHLNGVFAQVLKDAISVYDEGEYLDARGDLVSYSQNFLPLGFTDEKVDAVFGVVEFHVSPPWPPVRED